MEPIYTNIYISPSPGMFPIIAWGGFCIDQERTIRDEYGNTSAEFKAFLKKEIDYIKDMGFTTALRPLWESFEYVQPSLGKSGLGIIGQTPADKLASTEVFSSYIAGFLNCNTINEIVGWLIVDEPKFNQLELCRDIQQILIKKLYRLKSMNIWINCICQEDSKIEDNKEEEDKGYTGGYSYPGYLDYIQKLLSPQVWSFDQYPIRIKDNGDVFVQSGYFRILRCYMLQSKKTGRPFWAFCQCLCILRSKKGVTNGITTPKPSYPLMRFEAFCSLAYGAQGLEYWSLTTRGMVVESSGLPRFGDAPLDEKGDIHDMSIYNAIKTLNSEIRKGQSIFLGAVPKKVRHTGEKTWEGVDYYQPGESFGPLHSMVTTSKGAIVSWLVNGSDNYLLIVNHDPLNSQAITLYVDSLTTIWRVSLTKQPDFSVFHEGDESKPPQSVFIKQTLEAGGYVLLKW